jgi:1-acyl-sn-glycerol-3-phosphate acyltransferase
VKVDRDGHVPGERVLVVANHRSYIDIPILLAALPCVFLAKDEVASWPLFGRAAARLRTVFVQRDCRISRREARHAAGDLLSRGISFAAFPEGTTSGGPGIRVFLPGLFRLAEERGFPVLPVAIHYADPEDAFIDTATFLPHFLATSRKRNVRVQVRFGPLLRPDGATNLQLEAEAWIAGALGRLEGQRALAVPRVAATPQAATGAWAT